MIHLMGKLKRYLFLVVLILSFVIPVVPVTAFHKALEGINELTTTQCTDDHCVYLPMIISLVPEDNPGCRWAYTPGNFLYIPYKWGDRLQTPGSSWRIAFETGLSTWNGTLTPIWYYHNSSSNNIINTYNDELSGNRGITYITCIVNGSTSRVEVYGNIYYDIRDNYTIEQRRGIATHELGHGLSIGHISSAYPHTSLMYPGQPIDFYSTIYDPQPKDILLMNLIYP